MDSMRLSAVLLAAGAIAFASAAAASEQVTIPQGDSTLPAVLYRPEGTGPFPSAVALHGCGGLMNSAGKILGRLNDWAERLVGAGIAVVFPDSFTSRGLATQCRVRERRVRSARERVADANWARHWLQNQPWVIKDRVALIGWSTGASTSLWAVRPRAAVRDGMPDFRSAVAFYPSCRRLGEAGWAARIPTLILIGRADDWTSAAACEQMVAGARGRSAGATLITYPGAHHEFDRPDYPVRELTGLAFTADGSGRAHVGTNAAARADALRRVPQWLSR
jgi:dienelactone hydrolase